MPQRFFGKSKVFPKIRIPRIRMKPMIQFARGRRGSLRPGATQAFAGYTPAQIRHAYGVDAFPKQGAGVTIGIIDAYSHLNPLWAINSFSQQFGLPTFDSLNSPGFQVYSQTSGEVETYADIPAATFSSGLNSNTPDDPLGWDGEIELDMEWAHAIAPRATILLVLVNDETLANLAAGIYFAATHGANVISMSFGGTEDPSETITDDMLFCNFPGVAFVASAGDSGTVPIYPATSPCVLSVGGTSVKLDSNNNITSETAWTSADIAHDGATGGGISLYEKLNPSESLYYFQNYSTYRKTPDVSYLADPDTGVQVASYYFDGTPYFGEPNIVVGGTSAGAPQWAALLALSMGMSRQARTPFDPLLAVYSTRGAAGALYDISADTGGYPDLKDSAAPGYDLLTGIGSPRAGAFIPAYLRASSTAYSVNQFYSDLLGRSNSPSELGYWTERGAQGESSASIARTILISSPEGANDLVGSWYRNYLGRAAGPSESQWWANQIRNGVSVEQIVGEILSSPEYQARANARFKTSNPKLNFISALYQDLLYRAADPGAIAYFQTQSNSTIASLLLGSKEFRSNEVNALYYNPNSHKTLVPSPLLHRSSAPSPSELAYWVNSHLPLSSIAEQFLGSAEYSNEAMNRVFRYSDIYLQDSTETSVVIHWTTSEPARSLVHYGSSVAYTRSTQQEPGYSTNHSVALTGLSSGETLHFQIVSVNSQGNTVFSPDWTASIPDLPPVIWGNQVENWTSDRSGQEVVVNVEPNCAGGALDPSVKCGAAFLWQTDKPSLSFVNFGLDTTYGFHCEDQSGFLSGALVTNHVVYCLWPNPSKNSTQLYHYQVESVDATGASSVSPDSTFTTVIGPSPSQ